MAAVYGRVADEALSAGVSGRASVLVVDDEAMIGSVICRLLKGHDVVAVTGARAALERIGRGERFDLILCDLEMPEMDGVAFHEALVGIAPELAERVVFVSGRVAENDEVVLKTSGVRMRVAKPFDVEQLRAIVKARVR